MNYAQLNKRMQPTPIELKTHHLATNMITNNWKEVGWIKVQTRGRAHQPRSNKLDGEYRLQDCSGGLGLEIVVLEVLEVWWRWQLKISFGGARELH